MKRFRTLAKTKEFDWEIDREHVVRATESIIFSQHQGTLFLGVNLAPTTEITSETSTSSRKKWFSFVIRLFVKIRF